MRKLNFYLAIIDGIRDDLEFNNISKIAKKLNVSKQYLNPYVQNLKKQNVLVKIGNAWRIDNKKVLSFVEDLSKNVEDLADAGYKYPENTIRGHNFRFTLTSNKIPLQKERRGMWEKHNIKYHDTKSGTWFGDKIELGGFTTRITPNSIISDFSKDLSIYGSDAESIFIEATYKWKQLIHKIESIWGYSLKKKTRNEEPAYEFKSSETKHYALVNNTHAKILADEKKKLYVRSENGTLWLLADLSHNINEMEVVGSPDDRNQENATQFLQRFYNDAEVTRVTMQDVLKMQLETTKNINVFSQENKRFSQESSNYAENIKSHIKAVQDLGKAVKKLTGLVEERKRKVEQSQSTLKGYF